MYVWWWNTQVLCLLSCLSDGNSEILPIYVTTRRNRTWQVFKMRDIFPFDTFNWSWIYNIQFINHGYMVLQFSRLGVWKYQLVEFGNVNFPPVSPTFLCSKGRLPMLMTFLKSKRSPTYPWSIPERNSFHQLLVEGSGVCSRGMLENSYPKNHGISKLVVWSSQTPAIHIQTPQ